MTDITKKVNVIMSQNVVCLSVKKPYLKRVLMKESDMKNLLFYIDNRLKDFIMGHTLNLMASELRFGCYYMALSSIPLQSSIIANQSQGIVAPHNVQLRGGSASSSGHAYCQLVAT